MLKKIIYFYQYLFSNKPKIIGQEFVNGKTIFLIKHRNTIIRKSACDLYLELRNEIFWDINDLKIIIISATQEQVFYDLNIVNKIYID